MQKAVTKVAVFLKGDGKPMTYSNSKDTIKQNLKDAGCTSEQINRFFAGNCCETKEIQIALLQEHREGLLAKVHQEEKKICCLDYLIYQLKNQEEN